MTPPRRRPSGPTRGEVVRGIARELDAAGLESPAVEAERLVSSALDVRRSELGVSHGEPVAPEEAAAIARAVGRRLDGEPLQHIEASAAFRRVELVSDRRALIPRPETEQLVDRIAAWAAERGPAERALDIGTGSGAVALALLEEGLARRVLGLDVSDEALEQAAENAAAAGREGLALRRCGPDVWSSLEPGERFDLIVSNPPYVTSAEWADLDPAVRDHEPRVALDGGEEGLDVLRLIIGRAAERLTAGGGLFLEIGAAQGAAVLALLERETGLTGAWLGEDLSGRTRFAGAGRA